MMVACETMAGKWPTGFLPVNPHGRGRDCSVEHSDKPHPGNAIFTAIIRNQFGRRNLDAYQRTKLALRLEDTIAARAKANQQHAGGALPQKSAEAVETREEIAKLAGVSLPLTTRHTQTTVSNDRLKNSRAPHNSPLHEKARLP